MNSFRNMNLYQERINLKKFLNIIRSRLKKKLIINLGIVIARNIIAKDKNTMTIYNQRKICKSFKRE